MLSSHRRSVQRLNSNDFIGQGNESPFPRRFGGVFFSPLDPGGGHSRPSHQGAKERNCSGSLFPVSGTLVLSIALW